MNWKYVPAQQLFVSKHADTGNPVGAVTNAVEFLPYVSKLRSLQKTLQAFDTVPQQPYAQWKQSQSSRGATEVEEMAGGLRKETMRIDAMDNVYVVVVKDATSAHSMSGDLAMGFAQDVPPARKYRVAVWRSVQRNSKECLTRDKMLGMVAMLGISVASWAGVAVIISHLVR